MEGISLSYGDFRGTVSQAMPLLKNAMTRADTLKKKEALAELKNTEKQLKNLVPGQRYPFVIYHNWVVNTPLETGIADAEKGVAALQTARKYENPFGVYVTGIDKIRRTGQYHIEIKKKNIFLSRCCDDNSYRCTGCCSGKLWNGRRCLALP